jgi:catechol 2,3-dioxygenase-like lactoylglutathione lyase family enzyme
MTNPDSQGPTRTKANDHMAIRVTDMEVSTLFYINVFGAQVLTNPFVIEGDFAEEMLEGPAGVKFKLRQLTFESGVVELFQFLEPAHAANPIHATQSNLLHMGFQVDNVELVAAIPKEVLAVLSPAAPVINPFDTKLLLNDTSPFTNNLPLNDTSPDVYILPFNDKSSLTIN